VNLSLSPAWSALGILAALAIVVGSILLVAYAIRRGLVHRDLDGTIADEGSGGTIPAATGGAAAPSRAMGMAGVIGPGNPPTDCAQSWAGCPQATANPQATPNTQATPNP
jgi:hypothetical protein